MYRVPEPAPRDGRPPSGSRCATPTAPHDAEALLVDPRDGTIVIVTKSFSGPAASTSASRAALRARHADARPGQAITAGDVSADGRTIVLRSYDRAYVWTRRPGRVARPRARGASRASRRANLLAEGQGEALALSRDGRAFYTVPEGARPALRRYGR